jgi:hypothetical protein
MNKSFENGVKSAHKHSDSNSMVAQKFNPAPLKNKPKPLVGGAAVLFNSSKQAVRNTIYNKEFEI